MGICVENKIQRGRLRWFGHVERKEENNWVCTSISDWSGGQRCSEENGEDMSKGIYMGIKEEMAQDRCLGEMITGGPTRASADA